MNLLQRFGAACLLVLLGCHIVVGQFSISVASLEVAIGQPFTVSWALSSIPDDFPEADICLNTNSGNLVFIKIGSIEINNRTQGSEVITLNNTIVPQTYTLGIRFPGCSFLLAQEFDDFVVT